MESLCTTTQACTEQCECHPNVSGPLVFHLSPHPTPPHSTPIPPPPNDKLVKPNLCVCGGEDGRVSTVLSGAVVKLSCANSPAMWVRCGGGSSLTSLPQKWLPHEKVVLVSGSTNSQILT